MRKNLSEELEINDDIKLEDGEELKPEVEKEKDKLDKEVQKELDAKNKISDEIKDAEAPKAEVNNGLGKSTKIKQFVEKLTLEEPSDTLNEAVDNDFDDELFEYRCEIVGKIYNALEDYWNYMNRHKVDLSRAADEIESVGEEALYHFEDYYN